VKKAVAFAIISYVNGCEAFGSWWCAIGWNNKTVTIGPGGEMGEGATKKDFINSNILSLKCCNQVKKGLEMRTSEQLLVLA
jgi:hypothetical protein